MNKIDWTEVGREYTEDKPKAISAINKLTWKPVNEVKTLPMSQGMAINALIKEFKIPNISDIAINGWLEDLPMYGVRAHYSNGTYDFIVIDSGTSITPIAAIRKDN